jgi:hypothetical protein
MAKIIPLPGLIHFEYQIRGHMKLHFSHEKTFRDFLKAKKLLISREGYFYRKGKERVDLTQTVGRVLAWGKVKSFSTVSFSAHKQEEDG